MPRRLPLSSVQPLPRGLALVDLMVGLTIGLLVTLAAVGTLIMTRASLRSVTDSTALEQQATLALLQIGQQISQAGAINAYVASVNPDANTLGGPAGTGTVVVNNTGSGIVLVNNIGSGTVLVNNTDSGTVVFDTRPAGIGATYPTLALRGTDGTPPNADTLTVSYAAPNDGSMQGNCLGNHNGPLAGGVATRLISQFSVDVVAHQLLCGDGVATPSPIASNVVDLRVHYLSLQGAQITTYSTAASVPDWTAIEAVQVCLEMQGDPTQAPAQTLPVDCEGDLNVVRNDQSVHRIVQNTFYLTN